MSVAQLPIVITTNKDESISAHVTTVCKHFKQGFEGFYMFQTGFLSSHITVWLTDRPAAASVVPFEYLKSESPRADKQI